MLLKDVSSPEQREKVLLRGMARAMLSIQFQRAERSIWGSQVDLLAHLNSRRELGETLEHLKTEFYDRAAQSYPEVFRHYGFDDYLEFLRQSMFIQVDGDRAYITAEGAEYLVWRVEQAMPPKLWG